MTSQRNLVSFSGSNSIESHITNDAITSTETAPTKHEPISEAKPFEPVRPWASLFTDRTMPCRPISQVRDCLTHNESVDPTLTQTVHQPALLSSDRPVGRTTNQSSVQQYTLSPPCTTEHDWRSPEPFNFALHPSVGLPAAEPPRASRIIASFVTGPATTAAPRDLPRDTSAPARTQQVQPTVYNDFRPPSQARKRPTSDRPVGYFPLCAAPSALARNNADSDAFPTAQRTTSKEVVKLDCIQPPAVQNPISIHPSTASIGRLSTTDRLTDIVTSDDSAPRDNDRTILMESESQNKSASTLNMSKPSIAQHFRRLQHCETTNKDFETEPVSNSSSQPMMKNIIALRAKRKVEGTLYYRVKFADKSFQWMPINELPIQMVIDFNVACYKKLQQRRAKGLKFNCKRG